MPVKYQCSRLAASRYAEYSAPSLVWRTSAQGTTFRITLREVDPLDATEPLRLGRNGRLDATPEETSEGKGTVVG